MKTAITALVVGRAGKQKGAGRVQPLFDAALSHRKSKSSQRGSVASTGLRRSPTSDPGNSAYRAQNRDPVIIVVMMVVMMMMMVVMMVMFIANELHVWVMATRRVGNPQKRGGIGNGIKQFAK